MGSRRVLFSAIIFSLLVAYNNCGQVQFSQGVTSAQSVPPGNVCNPFGGGGGGTAANGLVSNSIHYLTPDQIDSNNNPIPTINGFNDLWTKSNGVYNVNVFMSNINTPNVFFSLGFSVDGSQPLTAGQSGTTLIQYFGLKFMSNFVTGNLPTGDYQLAVLSDDGSNLKISGGTQSGDFVINNDNHHSLQMGCFKSGSNTPPILHLTANSSYPLEFDYYQGPRITIGLMLLYRPVPPGNPADAQCGLGGGNDGYFFVDNDGHGNPISPSQPTQAYTTLVTQQYPWTVVPVTNYVLPATNPVNPCE